MCTDNDIELEKPSNAGRGAVPSSAQLCVCLPQSCVWNNWKFYALDLAVCVECVCEQRHLNSLDSYIQRQQSEARNTTGQYRCLYNICRHNSIFTLRSRGHSWWSDRLKHKIRIYDFIHLSSSTRSDRNRLMVRSITPDREWFECWVATAIASMEWSENWTRKGEPNLSTAIGADRIAIDYRTASMATLHAAPQPLRCVAMRKRREV